MKPSKARQTRPLGLVWEADESGIWESLKTKQQRELTECLARLWMQYVNARQQAVPSNVTTSVSSLPTSKR
jgi:hypothetical protein